MDKLRESKLPDQKRACLVYVSATEDGRAAARAGLEKLGYSVCEVKAELDDAQAARSQEGNLPVELADCISTSDLCVFLLPEIEADDGVLDVAASLANQLGKCIVGVVAGKRGEYPLGFDDHAASMVRKGSGRFDDAVCGAEIWEQPDGSLVTDRTITHIRCQ